MMNAIVYKVKWVMGESCCVWEDAVGDIEKC